MPTLGSNASLREAIRKNGWPVLRDLRGEFIFVLMGGDDSSEAYLRDQGRNGTCFAAPEEKILEKINVPADSPWQNSIFFNCHNLDGAAAPRAVFDNGFVSRIWRIDDQGEYDFAMSSLAHHLATDHVTQDLFRPLLTHSNSQPFSPF